MERRRGFRTAVCRSCGTAWGTRSARFCGRCGAQLDDARSRAIGTPARPDRFRHLRAVASTTAGRRAAIVVAVLAVAGAAHLVGSSTELLDGRPAGTGVPDVELPDPTEVAGDADRSGPHGCVPEGCERWRLELDHDGWVWPGDGIFVDTEQLRGGLDGVGTGEMEDGVGTGEMEDRAPHALPIRIRTYAVATGELLWERSLRAVLSSMSGMEGAFLVDGLVLVTTPSGLVALGADDGEERWVSEVSGGAPVNWTTIDGDLVIATGAISGAPPVDTGPGELALEEGRRVDLWRIDGTSGAVRWRVEGQHLLGFGRAGVFVAGDEPGAVVLLDAADGAARWEQVWPEVEVAYLWPTTANGRVVLTGESGVVVASLATGETLAQFDRDASRPGPVELVGDLLVIGPPWPDASPFERDDASQVRLVTLQDPEPRAEVVDRAVAVFPLFEGSSRRFLPESEATGLALLIRSAEGYTLHVLDPDGEERWERRWAVEGDDCCWRASLGFDGRSLVVVPEGAMSEPVEVLSLADGETLETVTVPVGLEPRHHLTWLGPVFVAQAQDHGGGLVVVGPGGRFSAPIDRTTGGYGIHGWDDEVLMIRTGRTLVGLDLEVLTGAS